MSEIRAKFITDLENDDTIPMEYVIHGSAKAWGIIDSAGNLTSGFNMSSSTQTGTGTNEVTFTNGFANTTYVGAGSCISSSSRLATVRTLSAIVGRMDSFTSDTGANVNSSMSGIYQGELA